MKIQKTHSLIRLHKNIKNFINFKINNELMLLTDEVYIETRYPGELGMLPNGKPTVEQATELYNFAKEIFENTKKLLTNKD